MNAALEMEIEDWEKRSIWKLPTSITNLNKKAYFPQEVSFGPYHHGEDHLLPMEKHKERALLRFLKRSGKTRGLLMDSLAEKVKDLKSSYAELPKEWEDDKKFIRLMILDGCFMLEILRSFKQISDEHTVEYYAKNDPIFSRHGINRLIPHLRHDMLMLENQLPMLVLEKLLAFESEQKDCEHLNKIILELFFPDETPDALDKCLHVLDLYKKHLLQGVNGKNRRQGGDERSQGGDERRRTSVTIPSATELNLAGIRFSLNEPETGSLEDISFNRRTLKLPLMVVDDVTESMFLNLIAYERYHIEADKQEITSYIFFMDNIIDTERDVALLKSSKIIENFLGSDQDVAELFNSLAKGITLDPDSKLNEVLDNIHTQYHNPWIAGRTNLNRTVEYFRNRWAFLSLVAAVLLFALTITQTVFTILPYYKSNSHTPPPAVPPPPPLIISRRLSSYHHL